MGAQNGPDSLTTGLDSPMERRRGERKTLKDCKAQVKVSDHGPISQIV